MNWRQRTCRRDGISRIAGIYWKIKTEARQGWRRRAKNTIKEITNIQFGEGGTEVTEKMKMKITFQKLYKGDIKKYNSL